MNTNEPGLFDLPDVPPPALPERSQRGRNRETWVCTATAEVTVTDAAAVREAWARAEERAVTTAAFDDPDVGAAELAKGSGDPIDLLPWLIWPTDGLDALLEAGAVRVLEASSVVERASPDRATLTWSLTFKLNDVVELRRLAVNAHPEQEALIKQSLEAAWDCAADPVAPLRALPGIEWQPPEVEVRHLPRRAT
jgi:hypothetical protein